MSNIESRENDRPYRNGDGIVYVLDGRKWPLFFALIYLLVQQ